MAGEVGTVAAEFAAEAGAEAADVEVFTAGAFELGEEPADAVGEFFGSAEVERPLPTALAEGEAVVGAERAALIAFNIGNKDSRGSEKRSPGEDLRFDLRESRLRFFAQRFLIFA